MSVNINDFKNFVEGVSAKVQVGNTLTVEQFNTFCNQAQLLRYEYDRNIFIAKDEISFYLSLFLKNLTTSVPVAGSLPYPADLEHIASIRSYYIDSNGVGIEVPVQSVRNSDWGKITSSQLLVATKEYPKYSWFETDIRFAPKNIGVVMLDYFRTPVKPEWNYTIVNNRPVYDPLTSVNFEWDSFAMNNIAGIFLELFATTIKDAELTAFAQAFQQQSNTPL